MMKKSAGLVLALFLLGSNLCRAGLVIEGENIRHRLGHWDAGRTIALKIGEKFTVTLERKAGEGTIWIWPMLPEEVVRLAKLQPETTTADGKITDTYTFVAVSLGTVDMFAELVRPDNYADTLAHYAFKVQVVP